MADLFPNTGLQGNFEECEDVREEINSNFEKLDVLTQSSVIGFVADEASLPTGVSGAAYITQDTNEIFYFNQSWKKITPLKGYTVYDKTQDSLISYDGTSWQKSSGLDFINLGAGQGLFAQKNTNGDIEFKSLVAGSGIILTSDAGTVTIGTSSTSSGVAGLPLNWYPDQLTTDSTNVAFDSTVGSNDYPVVVTNGVSTNAYTATAYEIEGGDVSGSSAGVLSTIYVEAPIPATIEAPPTDRIERTVMSFNYEGQPSFTNLPLNTLVSTSIVLQQLDATDTVLEESPAPQGLGNVSFSSSAVPQGEYLMWFKRNTLATKIRIKITYSRGTSGGGS